MLAALHIAVLQGDQVNKHLPGFNALKAAAATAFLFAAVLFLQGRPCAAQMPENAPAVQLASGQLRGVTRTGGGAEFLGIPYAQPPVGELRWHAPLPARPWSGIRDAQAFGAPCAQPL